MGGCHLDGITGEGLTKKAKTRSRSLEKAGGLEQGVQGLGVSQEINREVKGVMGQVGEGFYIKVRPWLSLLTEMRS